LFAKKKNATILVAKLKKIDVTTSQKIVTTNQKVYTVRTKGLLTKNKAQQVRKKLIDFGLKNSFIQIPINY
jgi:hypothetical protein